MMSQQKRQRKRNKGASLLILSLLLTLLSGCGKKKDEKYVSPSFDNSSPEVSTGEVEVVQAEYMDATYGDAAVAEKRDAISYRLPEQPEGASRYAGFFSETAYVNTDLGIAFDGAGTDWYFYDAAGIAAATGQSEDEVTNFMEGIRTPFDYETAYYAIFYTRASASNVIISSFNPELSKVGNLNAGGYLKSAAQRYPDVDIVAAHFLGKDCYVIDVPNSETGVGRRVQYAFDHNGLVILITLNLQEEDSLEDTLARFTTLE